MLSQMLQYTLKTDVTFQQNIFQTITLTQSQKSIIFIFNKKSGWGKKQESTQVTTITVIKAGIPL